VKETALQAPRQKRSGHENDRLLPVTSEGRARQERVARRTQALVLHSVRMAEGERVFTPVKGAA